MSALLDIAGIRHSYPLNVVAAKSLKLTPAGKEWKAVCPFHDDRSPSFYIFNGGTRWHCFGCGASGDVLDFMQRLHRVTLRQAAEMLGSAGLPVVQSRGTDAQERGADRTEEARAIWRAAVPIAGTPAELYLRQRGIRTTIPGSIRYARLRYGSRGPEHPCLIALVATVDHQLSGIQRTYLNATGSGKAAVPKPKLSLGRVRGSAIRLAPAAAQLTICEGLEDGLTLQQELGLAVWVSAGAGMMAAMRLPVGCNRVVIGADGDAAGEVAALAAKAEFESQGRAVRIIRPIDAKDFNQELMERVR